jgi:amino acid transporter
LYLYRPIPSAVWQDKLSSRPNMAEKEAELGVDSPTDHHYHQDDLNKMAARRGSKANEASDLYGDVQTAEEYGYVTRG